MCFILYDIYVKYFGYNNLKFSNLVLHSVQGSVCVNKGGLELEVQISLGEKVFTVSCSRMFNLTLYSGGVEG